jgi:hypothetical protein
MDRIKKQNIKKSLVLVLGFILILSCKTGVVNNDFIGNEEFIQKQKPTYKIEHMVFFNLKDSSTKADITLFKDRLRSLIKIKEVRQIFVSESQDLGDSRALDYDLVMTSYFNSRNDMDVYMDHPFHLIVKESLKPFLKGTPATLDLLPE